jgi:hypothetical protein
VAFDLNHLNSTTFRVVPSILGDFEKMGSLKPQEG